MTKRLALLLPLALLAVGCSGNGAQNAGPVPTAPESTGPTSTATTTRSSSTTTAEAPPTIALCKDQTSAVTVASHEGAAGTIRTLWRVKNTSQDQCRSFGYPGMDFRTSSGWQNVQVHRGGFQDINEPPASVVLAPGQSLFFVSYWSDVDSSNGPCKEFNRVKVTLPDNFVSAQVAASGCLDPTSVHVGPVTRNRPA